ncbi:type II secretion system protein GspG [Desulfothermobacter acidiphilus]|uniref:type II secretion system protein GspG n=1 Tax=Desulfothermobacter acidiphilus TaxID=1938353 RepID=UPI003F8AE05F
MSFYKLCRSLRAKGRDERGFTMVEMMVVLIIIAVLIAAGIWFYLKYIDRAKVTEAMGQMNTMAAALDSYYAMNGSYPATEADAISKAGLPEDPNNKNNLPKDPWGVKYSYSGGTSAYTLQALDSDGTTVRVEAKGTNGISTVTVK